MEFTKNIYSVDSQIFHSNGKWGAVVSVMVRECKGPVLLTAYPKKIVVPAQDTPAEVHRGIAEALDALSGEYRIDGIGK